MPRKNGIILVPQVLLMFKFQAKYSFESNEMSLKRKFKEFSSVN